MSPSRRLLADVHALKLYLDHNRFSDPYMNTLLVGILNTLADYASRNLENRPDADLLGADKEVLVAAPGDGSVYHSRGLPHRTG